MTMEGRMTRGSKRFRLVVVLLALVPVAGCESTLTLEGEDADARSDVEFSDGDADADSPDGDADGDSPDGEPETCTPEHMCYADFPCRDWSFCRDERTVVRCESVGCSSPRVCGTSCCSGGTCLQSLEAPTTCPDGTFCFEDPEGNPMGFGGPGRMARCLPDPEVGADAGADADADAGEPSDADYDAYSRPEVFLPYCN
jgi:hypothetical protein